MRPVRSTRERSRLQVRDDCVVKQETISDRLRIAITQLVVDDWRLLTRGDQDLAGTANEVAIAFALGWHLKPLLERRWDIDCEYNRATDAAGVADIKRRSDGRRVYPDLLVHRRRERESENNLLVLELKTNNASQPHEGGSVGSVADLVDMYRYQHGVFVDLGLADGSIEPTWKWYRPKTDRTAGVWSKKRCIYREQTRDVIVGRAKLEEAVRYRGRSLG